MAGWIWRHKLASFYLGIGVVLAAAAVVHAPTPAHNYRDLPTLERAVQAQEQQREGRTAVRTMCSHIKGASYVCTVGFSDGTTGEYNVTVSTGGSAFAATDH
jgi:hypothetical protein